MTKIMNLGKDGNYMIGAIIGDIVGSRFEFNNHRSMEFELFTEDSFFTDDSIMTLAVAKAIMMTDQVVLNDLTSTSIDTEYLEQLSANTVKAMQSIGRKYPDCGYGGSFYGWIFSLDSQPYNSYGNGAAMRISPVSEVASSIEEVKKLSKAVTGISHNHEEGIKGAEATAIAAYLARTGHDKEQIRKYIEDHYYALDFTIDEIRKTYQFNETCQETVPQAIQAFLEADSFGGAIRNAISIGGDSDTLASITGSIAEAYYDVLLE
ncbi:ADP-ribosylglycohydrolase [Petrocella atlantisensis]|uniref:ADP-ribosylglycohydrolase n=1 Tax=Petrocella atlantisensis TaxID=2173034 RepID=A0A3P7PSY6_9FIRM|nr:ADP-ribosylglycohydrolase family protein [Petrocella atlantisensis]VDN47167.1 ADP-ribosylglycohydrolase [Petrocella atlantisensis]